MKQIITLFSIILILSSCSITRITYGDISMFNTDGTLIRQWDNCSMEENVSQYDGRNIRTTRLYHGIDKSEGLSFMDSTGETHYISGGIIIVDNIRTTVKQPEVSNDVQEVTQQERIEEYKLLKKQIAEKKKYLKSNLSSMSDDEIKQFNSELIDLKSKLNKLNREIQIEFNNN